MLIAGKQPNQGFVLREKPVATSVAFVNTTRVAVSVDGDRFATINIPDVWRLLAQTPFSRLRLELENAPHSRIAPVKAEYDITTRIATTADLVAVEHAFNKHLNIANPSITSVTYFLDDKRCQGVAGDYATGMAEYALGIFVKEGRNEAHNTTPLARYREHFTSALPKFAPHHRALPRLLSAFMRFSLNDFSHGGEPTGHTQLDAATITLAGRQALLALTAASDGGPLRSVCPIDHGTDRILNFADRLAAATRWSPVLDDECRQTASAATLDLMDQEKATALWALAALRHNDRAAAIEPLERIAATYPFAEWASSTLDAVTQ